MNRLYCTLRPNSHPHCSIQYAAAVVDELEGKDGKGYNENKEVV